MDSKPSPTLYWGPVMLMGYTRKISCEFGTNFCHTAGWFLDTFSERSWQKWQHMSTPVYTLNGFSVKRETWVDGHQIPSSILHVVQDMVCCLHPWGFHFISQKSFVLSVPVKMVFRAHQPDFCVDLWSRRNWSKRQYYSGRKPPPPMTQDSSDNHQLLREPWCETKASRQKALAIAWRSSSREPESPYPVMKVSCQIVQNYLREFLLFGLGSDFVFFVFTIEIFRSEDSSGLAWTRVDSLRYRVHTPKSLSYDKMMQNQNYLQIRVHTWVHTNSPSILSDLRTHPV